MLDNLPIGIYVAGTSPVHALCARTKLLLLCWFALIFVAANHNDFHFGVYLLSFGLLSLAILLARIPFSYIWRRMRLLILLLALGIPITLMFTTGDTWHTFGPWLIQAPTPWGMLALAIGPIVVTYDGIWFVISLGAIFLLLFLGSMLLTMTTSPVALAEGIIVLLGPLRRFRVPVDEFGLMTLVALRFIPVLVQETEQLIKAQVSRGANFTSGPISARIRGASALLVPMLQGALRRAADLSMAIEARGYGVTGEATLLHEGRLRLLDWLALILIPMVTLLAYFKL
jgi:energy-coupling factor transport system permease protein